MNAAGGSRRNIGCILLLLACSATAAVPVETDSESWQSWEVSAGNNGSRACCYQRRGASWVSAGCQLDGDQRSGIGKDCVVTSDRIRLYVKFRSGKLQQIRAFSSGCEVTAAGEIRDLGFIDASSSIAWLQSTLGDNANVRSEAVEAIALHSGPAAFQGLTNLLEDRTLHREVREEALFWLAQLDSEQAFNYLDRLLSQH